MTETNGVASQGSPADNQPTSPPCTTISKEMPRSPTEYIQIQDGEQNTTNFKPLSHTGNQTNTSMRGKIEEPRLWFTMEFVAYYAVMLASAWLVLRAAWQISQGKTMIRKQPLRLQLILKTFLHLCYLIRGQSCL